MDDATTFSDSAEGPPADSLRATSSRALAVALNRVSPRINLHPYASRWPLNPIQMQRDIRDGFRWGMDLGNFIVTRLHRETEDRPDLSALDVLIVGRTWHLGAPLMCQTLGADVVSIDRFPVAWRDSYHRRFYAGLTSLCRRHLPDVSTEHIDLVMKEQSHAASGIACMTGDFGVNRPAFTDRTFDVVVSDMAIQHLTDPRAAVEHMESLMRPGALGIHKIDFRTAPKHPFRTLCLSDKKAAREFEEAQGRWGNRVRPTSLISWFEDAGFEASIDPIDIIDDATISKAQRKLPSKFADLPIEDLRIGSAMVFVRKRV